MNKIFIAFLAAAAASAQTATAGSLKPVASCSALKDGSNIIDLGTSNPSFVAFETGVTFAGERTAIVRGVYQPHEGSGCIAIKGLAGFPELDHVQAAASIAGVEIDNAGASYAAEINQAGTGIASDGLPTVRFTLENSHASITGIAIEIMITGRAMRLQNLSSTAIDSIIAAPQTYAVNTREILT